MKTGSLIYKLIIFSSKYTHISTNVGVIFETEWTPEYILYTNNITVNK